MRRIPSQVNKLHRNRATFCSEFTVDSGVSGMHGAHQRRRGLVMIIPTWVHWWNTERLHEACGYLPPVEYEAAYHQLRATTEAA